MITETTKSLADKIIVRHRITCARKIKMAQTNRPNTDHLCPCGNPISINNYYDKHSLCSICIGHECNLERRCSECQSWSDEHMANYLRNFENSRSANVNNEDSGSANVNKSAVVDDARLSLRQRTDEARQSEISEFKDKIEERFNQMMSGIAALIDSKLEQNSRNTSLSHRPNIPSSRLAGHGLDERDSRPSGSSTTAPPGVSRVNPFRSNVELEVIPLNLNKKAQQINRSKGQANSRQGKVTPNQIRKAKGRSKQVIFRDEATVSGINHPREEATVSGKSHPTNVGPNLSQRVSYENRSNSNDNNFQRSSDYEIDDENEEYYDDDDDDNYDDQEEEEDESDDDWESSNEQDGDNEDMGNIQSEQEDKNLQRLLKLIIDFYPQAKPQVPQSPPRQLLHEERFDSKKKTKMSKELRLYNRVGRVRSDVTRKVRRLMGKGFSVSKLLPSRRRFIRVAEDESFTAPPELNEEYERLSRDVRSTSVLIPLKEIVQMENSLLSLQENQSFTLWIISTLFSMIDEAGLTKSDPDLVNQMSESLSMSMVNQTTISHLLTSYMVGRRRDHFISHLPKSVTLSQKRRLAASSPFSENLFDPEVLGRVISEFKGDLTTSAHVAMTQMIPPPSKRRKRQVEYSFHDQASESKPSTSGQSYSSQTSSVSGSSGFESAVPPKPKRNSNRRGRGGYKTRRRFSTFRQRNRR